MVTFRSKAVGAMVAVLAGTVLSCGEPTNPPLSTEPTPNDAFALVMTDSLIVNRGGTNTITIADTTGGVAISWSTPPSGITVTGSSAVPVVLTVSASETAPSTPFDLIVTADYEGESVRRRVVVRAQDPPSKRDVVVRICNRAGGGGVGFAIRNEGESWVPVPLSADRSLRFAATDRVALQYTFGYPSSYVFGATLTRVIYATADELAELDCPSHGGSNRFAPRRPQNAASYMHTIGSWTSVMTSMDVAGPGPYDVITGALAQIPGSSATARRAIVQRGVALNNNDSTPAQDFNSSAAIDLDSAALIVSAGSSFRLSWLETSRTVGRVQSSGLPTGWFYALPLEALQPSDIQILQTRSGNLGEQRYFRSAQPTTVSFGPALSVPTGSIATGIMELISQAEYGDVAGINFMTYWDGRGANSYAEVFITKGYLGETPAIWTFRPRHFDGIGVPGFGRAGPAAVEGGGVAPLSLSAIAAGGTGRAMLIFGAKGSDGDVMRYATHGYIGPGMPYPWER